MSLHVFFVLFDWIWPSELYPLYEAAQPSLLKDAPCFLIWTMHGKIYTALLVPKPLQKPVMQTISQFSKRRRMTHRSILIADFSICQKHHFPPIGFQITSAFKEVVQHFNFSETLEKFVALDHHTRSARVRRIFRPFVNCCKFCWSCLAEFMQRDKPEPFLSVSLRFFFDSFFVINANVFSSWNSFFKPESVKNYFVFYPWGFQKSSLRWSREATNWDYL